MIPTDIEKLRDISAPVSVDGTTYAVISRPDIESNTYPAQVFAVTASGPVRISHGWRDTQLKHAGETFALIRAGREDPGQLYAGPHPGAVSRYTAFHLGVSSYVLKADGTQALVIARIPETGRYGTDEAVKPHAEAPRRITRAQYQSNGLGYMLDRPARLFTVDLPKRGLDLDGVVGADDPAAPEEITAPAGDLADPQYTPSGDVSYLADHPEVPANAMDLRTTVWITADGTARALDVGQRAVRAHRWIDADTVLFTGIDLNESVTDFVAQVPGLFVHRVAAGTTERITSADELEFNGQHLAVHRQQVFATVSSRGAERLISIPLTTVLNPSHPLGPADVTFISGDQEVVTGVGHAGERTVVAAARPDSSGVLAEYSFADGSAGVRTELLNAVDPELRIVLPEELTVPGAGGDIQGWVAIPEGDGPFPVILNIHGGPFAGYTHALFDETQVLVEAGYAVVYSNPRGSYGRGRAWGKAVQGDMADPARADVLAVLDAALEKHPQLDSTRLGVQGGSYGGYLTAMVIGAEDRFKGAVVERGYLNPDSFVGTSDIGRFFSEEYSGTDPENIARQSPMNAAKRTSCPTLVMHSELDFRCPLEQAQQYFAQLQRSGVDAELLIFPGENHELSRSGQPRHRQQRFEAFLDWWAGIFGTEK